METTADTTTTAAAAPADAMMAEETTGTTTMDTTPEAEQVETGGHELRHAQPRFDYTIGALFAKMGGRSGKPIARLWPVVPCVFGNDRDRPSAPFHKRLSPLLPPLWCCFVLASPCPP